ncbi:MAG: hypothetical protein Q9195_002992 [Heterodermia aff. obscurata]
MAPHLICQLFEAESFLDRYWNEQVHYFVLGAVVLLEKAVYADMVQKGMSLEFGDATRNGLLFKTPLSQTSCSDTEVRTAKIKALQDYIGGRFWNVHRYLDSPGCKLLLGELRKFLQSPNADEQLELHRLNLDFSYEVVRDSMLAPDCAKEFCWQFSDH